MPPIFRRTVFALLVSLPAVAESTVAQAGKSLTGYVYYPDRSIRPLLGYPGAAYPGEPSLDNVDFASISPDGRWAVIVQNGQTRILRHFENSAGINLNLQTPERVIWSADQTIALLYSSTSNVMQAIRLRDSGPELERETDLSTLGPVTMLALSGSGDRVAVGTRGGVYQFSANQQPVRIGTSANPVHAVFGDNGKSLYVLDKGAQWVILVFGKEGREEQLPLMLEGAADGPAADPVSIHLSGNARYLLVADRARKALQVYDTSVMRLASELPLDYAPSTLELLTTGSVFLVKPGAEGITNFLIVMAKDYPEIYFVPPPGPDR